jgi:hypothetical protein
MCFSDEKDLSGAAPVFVLLTGIICAGLDTWVVWYMCPFTAARDQLEWICSYASNSKRSASGAPTGAS